MDQALPPLRRAKVVEAAVDRNAVDPGTELRPTLELRQILPDADRDLLAHVLALVLIRKVAATDAVDPVAVRLDHRSESRLFVHGIHSCPLDDRRLVGVTAKA